MQGRNVIRAIFFILFFSVGAGSLSVSVLCDDLVEHYQNAELLRRAEEYLDRLKSLDADYAVAIKKLQVDPNDPNSVRHLAGVTLGPEHHDPNTVYPRATAWWLEAVEQVLADESSQPSSGQSDSPLPWWLSRCNEPRRKITLFFCGVVLVLTSLVCFGPRKDVE
jgi:hypothetical protein